MWMHKIGNGMKSPRRLLGPAEVLGPIDWECRKPSSIRSSLSFCSSTLFLNLACPLNIFFMPFQIDDMKVLVSLGGGCCQKAPSSSSSLRSSEEVSAGTSFVNMVGVHTTWKQLLWPLVIHFVKMWTQSYDERLHLTENVCTGKWQRPDTNTSHPECGRNWQPCVARGRCSNKPCAAWSSGCV